jgi:two-component system cell cycle sensor histidine kinase/response regulator CckA
VPTILVLESDLISRQVMGFVLRKRGGYTVLEASTSAEAMTCSRRYQIDLAIIDAATRDAYAGGRGTARQLTRICPGLRFLFVSGYPRDLLVAKQFLQSDDPLLARPFNPRVLLERVEQLLSARAPNSLVMASDA